MGKGYRWQKGQSGNPAGKPRNPARQEVIDIFKQAAPELMRLAIKKALAGNDLLLKELIKKALPDKVEIEGTLEVVRRLDDIALIQNISRLVRKTGIVYTVEGEGTPPEDIETIKLLPE